MSSKTIDDGGAAFPCEGGSDSALYPDPGMSLRDWFAGQAISGVIRQCATDLQFNSGWQSAEQYFAMKAYAIDDAMIAAGKAGA